MRIKCISIVIAMMVMVGLPISSTAKDLELPVSDERVEPKSIELNGRKLGIFETDADADDDKPLLLLLSGPTDNWHSDSAWWIVGQNYLSQAGFDTIAVDRAGHAGTPFVEQPSYAMFAKDLEAFISQQKRDLIVFAFASSNLSLQLALQHSQVQERVKGVVLIDADVLTEHSIQHYSADTEGYRQGWKSLEDYIASGKYDQRIQQKLESEKKHVKALLTPELESYMDWQRYDIIEEIRSSREYQIYKFKETTAYLTDLRAAEKSPLPKQIPLVVIDSDFESAYLETLKDENVKASISQWREEGIRWYFNLAQQNQCGAYWPVPSQEHLVMMEQPNLLLEALVKIQACGLK